MTRLRVARLNETGRREALVVRTHDAPAAVESEPRAEEVEHRTIERRCEGVQVCIGRGRVGVVVPDDRAQLREEAECGIRLSAEVVYAITSIDEHEVTLSAVPREIERLGRSCEARDVARRRS